MHSPLSRLDCCCILAQLVCDMLLQESRQCLLCQRDFTSIKSILGCRNGRNSGSELEYYIRWTGRPFRDACWVSDS